MSGFDWSLIVVYDPISGSLPAEFVRACSRVYESFVRLFTQISLVSSGFIISLFVGIYWQCSC